MPINWDDYDDVRSASDRAKEVIEAIDTVHYNLSQYNRGYHSLCHDTDPDLRFQCENSENAEIYAQDIVSAMNLARWYQFYWDNDLDYAETISILQVALDYAYEVVSQGVITHHYEEMEKRLYDALLEAREAAHSVMSVRAEFEREDEEDERAQRYAI